MRIWLSIAILGLASPTRADVHVDLPPVPDFALPPPAADGAHSARELRVSPRKLLGAEIAVHGVITWVYDCATAERRPKETDAAVRARIAEDPTLCERPKFYVGDTAGESAAKGLWIVDVPRPWSALELARLPHDVLAAPPPDRCMPTDKKRLVCPPYKVGDEVVVVGTFTLRSPHGDANSDGLVDYHAMRNVTQKWETTGGVAIPPPADAKPPRASPPPLPPPHAPAPSPVTPAARSESLAHYTTATKLLAQGKRDEAAAELGHAVDLWPDNDHAWATIGALAGGHGKWSDAAAAFAHAVALRPDSARYEALYGASLYESAVSRAREEQAKAANVRIEDVRADLSAVDFDLALQHLSAAVALDPGEGRAQLELGRILRERGDAKAAATAFSRAIAARPGDANAYIALGELYLRWDYVAEAASVAATGTANVTDASAAANLWYVAGMAASARGDHARAIEAFTHALDARPDLAPALFQRGQERFQLAAFADAKTDLDAFLHARGAAAFDRQQATHLLADIAAHAKH